MLDRHCHFIRASLGSTFTHLIHVASPAGVARGIDIGTIVRRCHDHHAIAVDVDVGRGRSAPGETHRIYSPHLTLRSTERDRSRCRRWSWCCRGRGWLPIEKGILLGISADKYAPVHP